MVLFNYMVAILTLLAGADLLSTYWVAKKWGKNAKIEDPRQQRHQADDDQDDANHSIVDDKKSQGDEQKPSHNPDNSTGGGRHKRHEWIHLFSPLFTASR